MVSQWQTVRGWPIGWGLVIATWLMTQAGCHQLHAQSTALTSAMTPPPTCTSLPVATDTVEYRVYATLEAPTKQVYDADGTRHQDTITTQFRQQVLEAIRRAFVPPPDLALDVYQMRSDVSPPIVAPAVTGEAEFTLTPIGRLEEAGLTQSSLSAALDRALLDALHRADSAYGFPPPSSAGAQITRLYVGLQGWASKGSVLLFVLRVPLWHDGTNPKPDPRRPLKVDYPIELQRRGFDAALVVGFVIDETGAPVPSTFRLEHAEFTRPTNIVHRDDGQQVPLSEFVDAILKAMRKAHFIPGTINSCPVKQLAAEPFVFKMKR